MTGDRAHRLERRLREERTDALRILALPRAQLDEVRDGEQELDAVLPLVRRRRLRAREHEAALGERLERGRHRIDDEHAARLGDAMEQLDARMGQPARIAEIGERDERACDLLRRIQPLGRIDPHAETSHEAVHLGLGQCLEDVHKA